MSFVKTTSKGLILVDYSQLTNMAIRLRKEILTLRLNQAFFFINFILELKERLIKQGKWVKENLK